MIAAFKLKINQGLLRRSGFCTSVLVCFALQAFPISASPWLAPDDAYLRSDLQVLVDAGLIRTPISSYPIRWSRIGNELNKIEASRLPASIRQSYSHISYALQSALIGRGNKRVKAGYADTLRNDTSFAAPISQKWLGQSSYEMTGRSYAFRVAANYQRSPNRYGAEQTDYSLDDSYFALAADNFSLTIGSIQRWWGPTWIYNLAWGHTGRTVPGVGLAYNGYDIPWLGSWHIESFLGAVKSPGNNRKQWSNRIELSPTSWLALGAGYQKWFDKSGIAGYVTGAVQNQDEQQDQFHGDVRLSLPMFQFGDHSITQSIYVQGSTLLDDSSLGSLVYGWQSQFNLGKQYLRWVVEVKDLTDDGKQQWLSMSADRNVVAGLHHNLAINNSDVGEAATIKLLWVTDTDWELTLQGQRYKDVNEQSQDKTSIYLTLPLANCRLTFGSDYNPDAEDDIDQWNYWGVLDFRF